MTTTMDDPRAEHAFGCRERRTGQDQVQPEETQAEPEAEDAFHHATIARAREEVHRKAIPQCRREGRVLLLSSSHRDPGDILSMLLFLLTSVSYLLLSFFEIGDVDF